MNNQTTRSDLHALGEVAHWLLWLGFDRAADEIYAMIENASKEAESREWNEVFGG